MITTTDAPQYYAVKLVAGGPRVPLMVWYGVPADPVTGEPLDRASRWQVKINGDFVDPSNHLMLVGDVGYIKGERIGQDEYEYLLSVRTWAINNDPNAPESAPREAINLNKMKPIF